MSHLQYHGLVITDPRHGQLRFGIVELIGRRQAILWSEFPGLSDPQLRAIQRFRNRAYSQCAAKCRDTAFKLTLSLRKLSGSLLILENRQLYEYDGAPIEDAAIYSQAMQDAPYHLDAFISYLRILADCISFALPYFYQTKETIANKSFRDHLKWFVERRPEFDPEYTSILEKHTSWFNLLASRDSANKGVRDLNFHNLATYQFESRGPESGPREILISQVTSKGIAQRNVLETVQDITLDLFLYLDGVYRLFVERFMDEIPQYAWNLETNAVLAQLEMEDIQTKFRLYPVIRPG